MTEGMTEGRGTGAVEQYEAFKRLGLRLNMQRGQPSDQDFDLSNPMLTAVGPDDTITPGGQDIRNYSAGGTAGLPEARALLAELMDVSADQMFVWNNASLELQAHVLTWALLRGLPGGSGPWATGQATGSRAKQEPPKFIVTTPGYDRHFLLLQTLGFELLTVDMQPDGPDVRAIQELIGSDASIKGLLFVPTYSNPGGETVSLEKARQLARLEGAAPDFTVFADDAYRVHHLYEHERDEPVNFVQLFADAGNPDGVYVFGSTSKVTFAGAGLGYLATSEANVMALSGWLNAQSIGPNKVEQWRHVRFLTQYPGGWRALMQAHAEIIRPKFEAVYAALSEGLGDSGLATWKTPRGGYFISLDTALPVARRVVQLAAEAGVSLTPAGATYPGGLDPHDRNIRLAPTRPPVDEVRQAMQVVAACIRLASEEHVAAQAAGTVSAG